MTKENVKGYYTSDDNRIYFDRIAEVYNQSRDINGEDRDKMIFIAKTTTPQLPAQTNRYRGKVRDAPTVSTFVLHGISGTTVIVSPQGVRIWGSQNQRKESLTALEEITKIKLELKK